MLTEIVNFIHAHPEKIDFGSGFSRSGFETAGVVKLGRGFYKRENAGRSPKMPLRVWAARGYVCP